MRAYKARLRLRLAGERLQSAPTDTLRVCALAKRAYEYASRVRACKARLRIRLASILYISIIPFALSELPKIVLESVHRQVTQLQS